MEKPTMRTDSKYRLCKGVQVRSEKFGLLFYNYAGPKIYFVPSKDLVEDGFFSGSQSVFDLIRVLEKRKGWSKEQTEKQLLTLFRQLETKGLVYEQSIC